MLDIDNVPAAVGPLTDVGGCFAVLHSIAHGGGEERVPVFVIGWEPCGLGVHHNFFLSKPVFAPVVVAGEVAELGLKDQGPERGAGLVDDGCGGGVGGESAIPTAHEVGGLTHARIAVAFRTRSVIDSVGETVAHLLIDFTVDVGLDGDHVGSGEMVAAVERVVNALDAIGIRPTRR